jgi:tRNA A-37 threonylcarbamoyl transferase component Bud32/tetratricopeptide (TPR) repeat protein
MWRVPGVTIAAVDCLDDNAIAAYAANRLADAERSIVVEHLASCDDCLTLACAAARSSHDGEPDGREQIGRYQLVEMLGRGAMGSVYLARDPQLDRDVALKVVRSKRFAEPEVRARITREARAMAQIRHANVVTVHDAGELHDGVFIAMELVPGDTLASWLAARARSPRDIVRVFVAAGRGLAAAHAAGIVHRDFKPDNVLVDAAGRVAVTDFGLALVSTDPGLAATLAEISLVTADALTKTGMLLGTPRYMSPEQFRGEVTETSDQFSFAVALFEALYRMPPFDGATIGDLRASLDAHRLRPRPHGASRRLHRVLERALAGDPAQRYATMTELVDALERAARPRWRPVAIMVGAAAVITVVAVAWPRAEVRTVEPSRMRLVVARFHNQTGDHDLDDTLDAAVGAVIESSTHVDPVAGGDLLSLAQAASLEPTNTDGLVAALAKRDPRPAVVVRGSVERSGDELAVELEASGPDVRFGPVRRTARPDAVVGVTAEIAADLLEVLGDPRPAASEMRVLSPSVAAIHAWMAGNARAIAGDQQGAATGYRRAVELDPGFTQARQSLGLALYNTNDKGGAIVELERALAGGGRLSERRRLGLMGDYYGTVGRYSESIMAYQRLLAKWPRETRTQVAMTAMALDANSWPLALEFARAAAHDHPTYEVVRRNLVLADMGNELLDDAVHDGTALLAAIPQPSGIAIATLGSAYALLGRRGETKALLDRMPAVDPDLAPHAIADFAAYEGRLDDAAAALRGHEGEVDQLELGFVLARRGDRAGAIKATAAAIAGDTMPAAYLAASLAIESGSTDGMAERARAWGDMAESERRMFGKMLEGDLARAAGRPMDAVAAYHAAARIGDGWLVHRRLARAFLDAEQFADAERELAWCLEHRGQGAIVANPSLSFLPEVMLELARSKARRGAPSAEVRAAFQAVVELAPAAQHDPWTQEARDRVR